MLDKIWIFSHEINSFKATSFSVSHAYMINNVIDGWNFKKRTPGG